MINVYSYKIRVYFSLQITRVFFLVKKYTCILVINVYSYKIRVYFSLQITRVFFLVKKIHVYFSDKCLFLQNTRVFFLTDYACIFSCKKYTCILKTGFLHCFFRSFFTCFRQKQGDFYGIYGLGCLKTRKP